MMSHVVSEGTARRAALDGIPTAGKTGTTNAYRDAWFVGYTGNFTCAVWYGNDDYSPTNRMTGGSLPAQTWHDIMVAAHQGIEIKELPGVGMGTKLPAPSAAAATAANGSAKPAEVRPGPPPILTKRGADILVQVEKMLDEAAKTGRTGQARQACLIQFRSLSGWFRGGNIRRRGRIRAAQELSRAADIYHFAGADHRDRRRSRGDVDDRHTWHGCRDADDRRLDRSAQDRNRGCRSLFSRHHCA